MEYQTVTAKMFSLFYKNINYKTVVRFYKFQLQQFVLLKMYTKLRVYLKRRKIKYDIRKGWKIRLSY